MGPASCYGTKTDQHQVCLMCHFKMPMKMIQQQTVLETKVKNKDLRLKLLPKFFDIDKGMIVSWNYFSKQV